MTSSPVHVTIILTFILAVNHAKKLKFTAATFDEDQPFGVTQKCANSPGDAEVRWQPKDIAFGKSVILDISFKPDRTVSAGKACSKVYAIGTDVVLIASGCSEFACNEINGVFSGLCPLRQGVVSRETFQIPVDTKVEIPPGLYQLTLEIHDNSRHRLACVKADVTVVSDDNYHYDDDYDPL